MKPSLHYKREADKYVNFGKVIYDTRMELGLSRQDVAARSRGTITVEMLAKIEADHFPGIFLPPKLIKVLSVSTGVNFAFLLACAGHITTEQLRSWNRWGKTPNEFTRSVNQILCRDAME